MITLIIMPGRILVWLCLYSGNTKPIESVFENIFNNIV